MQWCSLLVLFVANTCFIFSRPSFVCSIESQRLVVLLHTTFYTLCVAQSRITSKMVYPALRMGVASRKVVYLDLPIRLLPSAAL